MNGTAPAFDLEATLTLESRGVDTPVQPSGSPDGAPVTQVIVAQPSSRALGAPSPGALSLYEIEEYLQALLDTEELTEGEDQLAIMAEIAHTGELARDKRDAVARFILSCECMAEAKKAEADRLDTQAKAMENLVKRLRARTLELVEQWAPTPKKKGATKKLEGRVFRLCAEGSAASLNIAPDAIIPFILCRVQLNVTGKDAQILYDTHPEWHHLLTVEPHKTAIRAILDQGGEVAGCKMKPGRRLAIR